MKIILAIDSFKGCLTSKEAESAAEKGIKTNFPHAEIVKLPMSDGGEGMLDAFLFALRGKRITAKVHAPLGNIIEAEYGISSNGTTAIIEMAKASGLPLIGDPNDDKALQASSLGTGELIADAINNGCKKIIIGLGGSATTDAGEGMLKALNSSYFKIPIIIASDVTAPLYGTNGAAYVFSAQKGASKAQTIEILDNRLRAFAEKAYKDTSRHVEDMPGAGAAGGMGAALLAYFNAKIMPGAELYLNLIHYADTIADADLIITGEGASDRQTLMGKLPQRILQASKGKTVILIAGRIADKETLIKAGFHDVICINKKGLTEEEMLKPETAIKNISNTMRKILK